MQHATLPYNNLGIKADRLLLPIDLTKCPLEIFPLANAFTKPFGSEVVLLHVLDRGKEIEMQRAERHLKRVGDEHLRSTVEASFRVRIGIPHEEIFSESRAINADLILLPTFTRSMWQKLLGYGYGETTRHLVTGGVCRVFVIEVQTRFNCFRRWAGNEIGTRRRV